MILANKKIELESLLETCRKWLRCSELHMKKKFDYFIISYSFAKDFLIDNVVNFVGSLTWWPQFLVLQFALAQWKAGSASFLDLCNARYWMEHWHTPFIPIPLFLQHIMYGCVCAKACLRPWFDQSCTCHLSTHSFSSEVPFDYWWLTSSMDFSTCLPLIEHSSHLNWDLILLFRLKHTTITQFIISQFDIISDAKECFVEW